MSLKIDEVSQAVTIAAAEEMVETHFIERRRRRVGGNMAPYVRVKAVGFDNHGHCIPAHGKKRRGLNTRVPGQQRGELLGLPSQICKVRSGCTRALRHAFDFGFDQLNMCILRHQDQR